MDDRMITAFGFPSPQLWQRQFLEHLLRTRGKLLRYFPGRQTPSFYSDESQRSYPQGYDLADLGPPKMLSELNVSKGWDVEEPKKALEFPQTPKIENESNEKKCF